MASESRKNIVYEEQQKERQRSVFDLPHDFFDSCRLFHDGSVLTSPEPSETSPTAIDEELHSEEQQETNKKLFVPRWSCNICKAEFESLEDQRSHFKSDFHRFNVKLSIIGKDSIKEDAFDESTSDSFFKDNDISSISGSEDENDKVSSLNDDLHKKARESAKSKVSVCLKTGEVVSFWKCLLMNECENVSYENDKLVTEESVGRISYLREKEVVDRLKSLVHETREKKKLRIMLLASGGHFAGCVFDGNSVVAHKTFHRYVVRARAGKKQSSKDASGKAASSAGASLRRYNELSLKKEIQELLAAWKPYFDLSSSIFIHAPSNNRQLLYNGDTPYFSNPHCVIRHMPFTIRRPTFKEAKRIYNNLTNMVYEVVGKGSQSSLNGETLISRNGDSPTGVGIGVSGSLESNPENSGDTQANVATAEVFQLIEGSQMPCESEIQSKTTALHEAAMSGNSVQTLELLEEGLDPCIKDERGRTPYMLATDKEVRNTFRRFMALNLDKWDWDIAKVPSPLTKEMEESQAAKQAEKDAKRKAKAKELKKLRKAKEKIAQAEAALKEKALKEKGAVSTSFPQMQARPKGVLLSKEEELKRAQAAEREKRAAAAEKRIAAAAALNSERMSTSAATSSPESQSGGNDINCSCCNVSLAGKVPFHRYNYKYCSTSCMHVHGELLEDE